VGALRVALTAVTDALIEDTPDCVNRLAQALAEATEKLYGEKTKLKPCNQRKRKLKGAKAAKASQYRLEVLAVNTTLKSFTPL
jgi:hypothetical protein